MAQQYYVNSDVLIRLEGNIWVVSNPRLRTHVELDQDAISCFIKGGKRDHITESHWKKILQFCKGRDRTSRGIGGDGLVADHSGYLKILDGGWLTGEQLFELLCKSRLLISDKDAAMDLVKPLAGLLDRESLGSFHQRVGQYLLLERRSKEPWREWQNQKFSVDGKSLLDTPYRHLQEPFFDKYFSRSHMGGKRILDFGCGNAYYTAKFAALGAHVIGMDSSCELLDIARNNYGQEPNLQLILTQSFEEILDVMSSWRQGSFDLIYLQDTLLLLLKPEVGPPSAILPELFAGFRRLLGAKGILCAMEPNPIFWLASRYGDPLKPYAIITEYRHPVFNVAPTLDRLLPVMASAGFALQDIQHPAPSTAEPQVDMGYQSEFPIWDFFVFVPV